MEVVINPTATPSEQVLAKALAEVKVSDRRGRIFTLKKPGVLAQLRLVEILGESAKNEVYMAMVLPLLYVAAIDEQPNPMPTRKSEVEALFQQLDEDGIEAVGKAVMEHFGASSHEADKAQLKK